MDKTNFGSLISKLADELPTMDDSYQNDTPLDEEEGHTPKSMTPPPKFDSLEKGGSASATLKSPAKLLSSLSFKK